VLVVYADAMVPPTTLQNQLMAEPGITSVTLFDGGSGTPTLAQLQQYDIVVPFSNNVWSDPVTLGNNLSSYLAGNGIVVALNFDWYGPGQSLAGNWVTTNTPFNDGAAVNFATSTLGTCTFAPLCSGVTNLSAFYRETVTVASGATLAATWADGSPLMAYKGRAVAMSAYLGDNPNNYTGQFSKVIANAGFWLGAPCTSPTPAATPTATATATVPPTFSISGTVGQCNTAGPSGILLPGVTMTLTGAASGSTTTDASGNYTFTGLLGGNYTITPSKATRPPGTAGINTTDVLAVQRHFLVIGTPLSGCRLIAADCAPPVGITTADVIAIQRYFLVLSTGIANVGKYGFTPTNRTYTPLSGNQTGQNYDTVVFGDVATPFAFPRAGEPPPVEQPIIDSDVTVTLPATSTDQSRTSFTAPVTTSSIDPQRNIVGFQGDITFDERVVSFESNPVEKSGLTGGNWNVSGNVIPGDGPIRTLRISAYSNDFAPLSGSGTLFELKMRRVSGHGSSRLTWAAAPDNLIVSHAELNTHTVGNAAPGSENIRLSRR